LHGAKNRAVFQDGGGAGAAWRFCALRFGILRLLLC